MRQIRAKARGKPLSAFKCQRRVRYSARPLAIRESLPGSADLSQRPRVKLLSLGLAEIATLDCINFRAACALDMRFTSAALAANAAAVGRKKVAAAAFTDRINYVRGY